MTYIELENYLIENKELNQDADRQFCTSANTTCKRHEWPNKDQSKSNDKDQVDIIDQQREGLVVLQKLGIRLICKRADCGYSWVFAGQLSRYYTTCPRCHSSVAVKATAREKKEKEREKGGSANKH